MTNEIAIKAANRNLANRTYWLSVYTVCQFSKLAGAPSFDEFYQNPWAHLEDAGQGEAPASMVHGYEPLLPAQAAVAQRLDALDAYFARQSQIQDPHQDRKQASAQSLPDMIPLAAFARPDRA